MSDIDAQLTNDGVYGTFVHGDVVIDFASVSDGAGGFEVSIDPLILDPERIPQPQQAAGHITIVDGEQPGEQQPPDDPGNGTDVFDDFLFAIDTELPGDHDAVRALRTAAAAL